MKTEHDSQEIRPRSARFVGIATWVLLASAWASACSGKLAEPETKANAGAPNGTTELDGSPSHFERDGGSPLGNECFDVPQHFSATCGGSTCHEGQSPAADLDLLSARLGERLIGLNGNCAGPLVDPANPEASVLYQKLAGSDCGNRMPLSAEPFSEEELGCVREWISGLVATGVDPDDLVTAGECKPNATEACYSGPAETADVGNCAPGERTCQPDRTWGACHDDVLPLLENCTTEADEDCDGQTPACSDSWSHGIHHETSDAARAVAVDSQGNVYVAGDFEGSMSLGGETFVADGEKKDVFLVKYDSFGNHLWSHAFAAPGNQFAGALTVDAEDAVYLVGRVFDRIDLGGGELKGNTASDDVFVGKFTSTGEHAWSRLLGGRDNDRSERIGIDADGNLLINATFAGDVDFDDFGIAPIDVTQDPEDPRSAGTDVVVYRLDQSDGTLLLAKNFGGLGDDYGSGIAGAADGSVYVSGRFAEDADFGDGVHVLQGETDAFLLKLAENGSLVWSRAYGGSGKEHIEELRVVADGVIILGYFAESIDFGAGALASAGERDVFLAKIAANGDPVWSIRFGDTADQVEGEFEASSWNGLDVDSSGNIYVAGSYNGTLDFGESSLESAGKQDLFILKFSADGSYLIGDRFGGIGTQLALDVAVGAAQDPTVVGRFFGSSTFNLAAAGDLLGGGSSDAYVVKFAL